MYLRYELIRLACDYRAGAQPFPRFGIFQRERRKGDDEDSKSLAWPDEVMTAPTFPESLPALMTTEDVLEALGRYTRESNESDRRTASMLGIKRATLRAWLQGADLPRKCILARLAGFLRRVGYL
jgi:hypothetical protein